MQVSKSPSSYSISDHAANDVFEPVNDAIPVIYSNYKSLVYKIIIMILFNNLVIL